MKKALIVLTSVLLVGVLLFGIAIAAFAIYVNADVDYAIDDKLFDSAKNSNTVTYLAYGKDALESVCKESQGPAKSWVHLDDVSEFLIDGFIAAEDRRFYKHIGFNLKRTVGAALNSFLHFTSDFGASTITQQVIKNISGDNERTLKRKAAEVMRAVHLEMSHSKDAILEVYLNVVPMSGNVFGVREASLRYFGKEPSELSLSEAATLVGITNAPSKYDPLKHPEACLNKRNRVLYAMKDNGSITEEEYSRACSCELGAEACECVGDGILPWFVETAREQIIGDLSMKYGTSRSASIMLLNAGTRVILTMDKEVQKILDSYFSSEKNLSSEFASGLEYAMVVCDSQSGDVKGIVGSGGEKRGNRLLNFATAPHAPASTLKPLALYAPLIDNEMIEWATIFDDSPVLVEERGDEVYMYPRNAPDVYDGAITVIDALKTSKNTVAVQMYEMLGAAEVMRRLKDNFGFSTLLESAVGEDGRVISDLGAAPLAMGQLTKGISLLDLTHAYTVLPSDGVLRGGRTYYGVFDSDGEVLIDNASKEKRVFKQSTARIMTAMLREVADSGTARAITLKETVDTAAKTGTSSASKDKLLVGYTPYFTAGIWTGYRDAGRGVYAQDPNHIEIWDRVMKEIHSIKLSHDAYGEPIAFSTAGLELRPYCKKSGCHAEAECYEAGTVTWGYFSDSGKKRHCCPIHTKEE